MLFDYIGDTRKSEIGHVNGSLNDLLSFGRMQADAKEVMDIYEQETKRDSLNNEVNVNSSQNLAFPHCTPEYIRAYIRRFGRMPDDCSRSMN